MKKKSYSFLLTFLIALVLMIPLSFALLDRSQATLTPPDGEPLPPVESAPVPEPAPAPKPAPVPEPAPAPKPKPAPEPAPKPVPVNTKIDFSALTRFDPVSVTWGPGIDRDEQNRSAACTKLQAAYGDRNAAFIQPGDTQTIYLTFDEGYENGYTPYILDTLKANHVSAVFFVTLPYVKEQPALIQRMIDEGHVVGNHSHRHKNFTTLSLEAAKQDVLDLHTAMLEQFDYTMKLFRPPEGAFSEQTLGLLAAMNYRTCLWSFAYADWDPAKQMAPADALAKLEGALCPGNIYLLHAVSQTNTDILGDFIKKAQSQGYTVGAPTDLYPQD